MQIYGVEALAQLFLKCSENCKYFVYMYTWTLTHIYVCTHIC